jgi:hypothetical protein
MERTLLLPPMELGNRAVLPKSALSCFGWSKSVLTT